MFLRGTEEHRDSQTTAKNTQPGERGTPHLAGPAKLVVERRRRGRGGREDALEERLAHLGDRGGLGEHGGSRRHGDLNANETASATGRPFRGAEAFNHLGLAVGKQVAL